MRPSWRSRPLTRAEVRASLGRGGALVSGDRTNANAPVEMPTLLLMLWLDRGGWVRYPPPAPLRAARSRSSRGPGHRPFTAATRVRISYGTPRQSRSATCYPLAVLPVAGATVGCLPPIGIRIDLVW